MKRIVIGMSGATGAIYGVRMIEVLNQVKDVETHLVMSSAAAMTINEETEYAAAEVIDMADVHHKYGDIGASISSGSFQVEGMIVAPCAIKSMSMISHSINENLLTRSADVTLKERRKLVLLVRETPLHLGHLRLMANLAEIGAIIQPPMPAFYHNPKSLDDIINHTVGRALDHFHIEHNLFERWTGMSGNKEKRLKA